MVVVVVVGTAAEIDAMLLRCASLAVVVPARPPGARCDGWMDESAGGSVYVAVLVRARVCLSLSLSSSAQLACFPPCGRMDGAGRVRL
jgi:hypothetical protein